MTPGGSRRRCRINRSFDEPGEGRFDNEVVAEQRFEGVSQCWRVQPDQGELVWVGSNG
jgi:hypothetical protein